jgi:hypothetical protein
MTLGVSSATDLENPEYAAKLFVAAASRMVKGDELLKLAETSVDTIDDKPLAKTFYNKAGELFSSHGNYMTLAGSVLVKTEDTELAARFFSMAGEAADSSDQMLTSATALADKIDDKEKAFYLLKLAEKKATTVKAFADVAQAVLNYADDENWKADIAVQLEKREQNSDLYAEFMNLEKECNTNGCFRKLAEAVHLQTGDTPYCRRLYEKAALHCNYFDDYLLLASGVHEHLGDQVWLKSIYNHMLVKWNSLAQINTIVAQLLVQVDSGREWAKELYLAREESYNQTGGMIRLAVSVFDGLEDEEWARSLYLKAEASGKLQSEFMVLALSVHKTLDDWKWAAALYEKAFDLCKGHLSFDQIIRYIIAPAAQKVELYNKLYVLAEKRFTSADDLLHLAESIHRNTNDVSWSERVYDLASMADDVEKYRYEIMESRARTVSNTLAA